MATFKYFNGSQELIYPRPLDNPKFWARFGYPLKGVRYDGYSKWVAFDPANTKDSGMLPVTRVIEFKSNPSLHKCDARCQHAKGRTCECSCGGKFHGFGQIAH